MTLKAKIIEMIECNMLNTEIAEVTGACIGYVRNVRSQSKHFGVIGCAHKQRKPKENTKSYVVYKFFLANPKAKNKDAARLLNVTESMCGKVKNNYLGLKGRTKNPVKVKRQILPQRKAMFDVDLSELKL